MHALLCFVLCSTTFICNHDISGIKHRSPGPIRGLDHSQMLPCRHHHIIITLSTYGTYWCHWEMEAEWLCLPVRCCCSLHAFDFTWEEMSPNRGLFTYGALWLWEVIPRLRRDTGMLVLESDPEQDGDKFQSWMHSRLNFGGCDYHKQLSNWIFTLGEFSVWGSFGVKWTERPGQSGSSLTLVLHIFLCLPHLRSSVVSQIYIDHGLYVQRS